MKALNSMESTYSIHGHTRSLSSAQALASTILPIASDISSYTPLTASPMDVFDSDEGPIELKIPLPSSSCCSDQDLEASKTDVNRDSGVGHHVQTESGLPEGTIHGATCSESISPVKDAPGPTSESLHFSIADLRHLAHLDYHESCRAASTKSAVEHLELTYGLHLRLLQTLQIAYGNLIDQYKSNDQAGFAGLHEAAEELLACVLPGNPRTGDPGTKRLTSAEGGHHVENQDPWIHLLSVQDQECVLAFLSRIRTKKDFLADCIASLSPAEMTAFTSSYHPPGIDLSVLANHSYGMTQFYRPDSQMMKLSRRMDNLQCFHHQDPFFTLMYACFDPSAKSDSREYALRGTAWSSTCARVITESKVGSDELIVAVADAFLSFGDWKLKPKFGMYLEEILSEGEFLTDPPPNSMPNATGPGSAPAIDHAVASARFFEKALNDLFALIGSQHLDHILPEAVLYFVHSTILEIQDPNIQNKARLFLVTRWYFASFLSSVILYPELQGFMMARHISPNARQKILKQLVIRMQAQVFDVLYPSGEERPVPPGRQSHILAIFEAFRPPNAERNCFPSDNLPISESTIPTEAQQITLSRHELCKLLTTLNCGSNRGDEPSKATIAASSTASSVTLRPDHGDNDGMMDAVRAEYGGSVNSDATATTRSPQGFSDGVADSSSSTADGVFDASDGSHAEAFGNLKAKLGHVQQSLKAMARSPPAHATQGDPARWSTFRIDRGGLLSFNSAPEQSFQKRESISSGHDLRVLGVRPTCYRTLSDAMIGLLRSDYSAHDKEIPDSLPLGIMGSSSSIQPVKQMLGHALAVSRMAMDFRAAHHWWQCLEDHSRLSAADEVGAVDIRLLNDLGHTFQHNLQVYEQVSQANESRMRSLAYLKERQTVSVRRLEDQCAALRVKMWYISDVKHSSTYEDASLVSRALRLMVSPQRKKHHTGTFNWARQRLRGQKGSDEQTLEALTALRDYGGRSKLADEQVDMTAKWLEQNNVETICKGEERLQRFCYEISKTVKKLTGPSMVESPVFWSSCLFRREKASVDRQGSHFDAFFSGPDARSRSRSHGGSSNARGSYSLEARFPGAKPQASNATHPGGSYLDTPMRSSWAPEMQFHETYEPFAPVANQSTAFKSSPWPDQSMGVSRDTRKDALAYDRDPMTGIQDNLYGLLISDLGCLLWDQGSETDIWIRQVSMEVGGSPESGLLPSYPSSGLPQKEPAFERTCPSEPRHSDLSGTMAPDHYSNAPVVMTQFGFLDGYRAILHRMAITRDPSRKLHAIWEMDNLIQCELQQSSPRNKGMESNVTLTNGVKSMDAENLNPGGNMPRITSVNLEKTIASCAGRRAGAVNDAPSQDSSLPPPSTLITHNATVDRYISLLRDASLRPTTLYLDLQLIAAFIPSTILDHTPQGKAFWDIALAALCLKRDFCNAVIEQASEITSHYLTSRPPPPETRSLEDAANLWLIAAKEGSSVAARELALFYLTHPDVIPRATMPMSKAGVVFKNVRAEQMGMGQKEEQRRQRPLDPLTFAVVFHWMEIAAQGGDREAIDFLRQGGGE